MLSTRPLQSICTACRAKLLSATVLDAGSRTLVASSSSSQTRFRKRIRLSLPPHHHASSHRHFSATSRTCDHEKRTSDDDTSSSEPAAARNKKEDIQEDDHNGAEGDEEGGEALEEQAADVKKTYAQLEAAARSARRAYGEVLPEELLSKEEFVVYERLYGTPLRIAPEEELLAEAEESEYVEEGVREKVRETLWVEGKGGKLQEVEFYQGAPEKERVVEEEGEGGVLEAEEAAEDEWEERDEQMRELEFEDMKNEGAGETLRADPLTLAGRSSTGAVQLPKKAFVEPISELLAAANKKHLSEVSQRVFGGRKLPFSTQTPRSLGGELLQKPIPLDPSQSSMSSMEGDAYLAAVMPGTYASVTSVLTEVRKRLGTNWIEGLLKKEGGPLILDVSSGGAAVVAWREILKAEWERMQEESGTSEPTPAPTGKASVITGSDTIRRRAAHLLENTTFLPRLPDTVLPGEKVGPKARKVYDIIIAPHALWSLREDYLRKAAVQKFWSLLDPRGGVLVLLEKGLPRGFEVIAGARALLLDNCIASPGATHVESQQLDPTNRGRVAKKEEGMIVAPCTNHSACPMYSLPGISRNRKDFCYFKQRYTRPPFLQKLLGAKDRNHEDVQFSYLAVRRGADLRRADRSVRKGGVVQGEAATTRAFEGYGDRHRRLPAEEDDEMEASEAEEVVAEEAAAAEQQQASKESASSDHDGEAVPVNELMLSLPRLILPPLKRRGHVILDMCTPAGRLERWTVARSFGHQAYRDARKSQWGDLWALGAATRVPRTVRLGHKEDSLPGRVMASGAGQAKLLVEGGGEKQRLSKEDKKRLKIERGKNWKKGKETRRMGREMRDLAKSMAEEEEDEGGVV